MKVIAITPHFKHDFLVATVIEGLYRMGVQVIATDYGNNVEKVYTDEEVIEHSKDADYAFIFSSKKTDPSPKHYLMSELDLPKIYIDGSEWTSNYHWDSPHQQSESLIDPSRRKGKPWINTEMYEKCDFYFKRECYPEDATHHPRMHPLPFGVVSKNIHISYQPIVKTIDVLCAFGQINTGMRAVVSKLCREYRELGFNIEIGEWPYDMYIQKMKESSIVVDAWGSGDCNARFYEAVANGACVMHQKPNILTPDPFVDGEHCIEFSDEEEFCSKLQYYLDHMNEARMIGKVGQRHALQYHTSKARAEYIFEVIKK
jgi:hypothetical protein